MYICTYVHMYICICVHMYPYIYIYIHVCIYIYILMYVCTYIHIYICVYVHTFYYVYIYICIYTYIYVYIHTYVCLMYVWMYVRTYVGMYVCTYVYVYVYVYVCVYVYVHVYVNVYVYVYVYIYGTSSKTFLSTRHTDTNYILYTIILGFWDVCGKPSLKFQVWQVETLVSLKSDKFILVDTRAKIQDFPTKVSGHLGSWIPASLILSQEESLGILDLGSWLRGSFPKKSLWASWILDPGFVDPFPRRVFGHLGSWILASWILSQEESLGILDLGSWLRGSFPKKSLWASWILDPGFVDPFPRRVFGHLGSWILASWILSQEESLGILDLGSWLRGSFPKKSLWASWILDPGFVDPFPRRVFGHLGSWILASWILSQEESLGILDLGSWLRGSFPKKSLWASWILDPGFVDPFPRRVFGHLGSWILASWILSQEESLGILDLGSWLRGSFPKKSLWASWILDPGFVDPFPRRVFGHLGSWILASWILSQEESLGILDLGSWLRGSFPKKSLWASWILDLGFVDPFPRRVFGHLGSWILASWILSQEESLGILDLGSWLRGSFTRRVFGHLGSWILASWILSQEESLGILDLGSWLRGSFPKKSLWASWILDPGFVDPFPRRVFGHLGSWILASWILSQEESLGILDLGSWLRGSFPKKSLWASWILDPGFVDPFPRRVFGHLGSWILASWILSQEESLGILDLGSWLRGSFPKKSLWASWILDPGFVDPFPRRVFGHLGSWILASWILSQEESLGILDPWILASWILSQEESLGILDLGSWLRGSFPKKSLWASWILDPGFVDPLQEESLGILDLGSWLRGSFPKKSLWASWILDPGFVDPFPRRVFGHLGSWILASWILSQEESLGILDLGSWLRGSFPKKSLWASWILDPGFVDPFPRRGLWASWILDPGFVDPFPRRVFGHLGSWILASWILSQEESLGILDPWILASWILSQEESLGILDLGSWLRGSFPKKSLWASWILDLGFVDPFPRRVFGHLGSWILASWILSQEESLGILDLGSWLRGSFPKKSLWASWILDPGFVDPFPRRVFGHLGSVDPGFVDPFPRRVFGHLGSWILASWILSQEESLGILDPWILASWILSQEESLGILDLGSWLRGSFPKKSLWASWILDPGFVDPFPRRVFGHLGSVDPGFVDPFPRRVFGHLGSWILASWILSQEESLGILDLGSWLRGSFPKKSLWASWIRGSWLRGSFPKKSLWASWILDPGLLVDPRFPKKSLWASWILDPGFVDLFPSRVFGHLGSWILASWILSQEESLGILDLGSWLRGSFPKKSLWASWIRGSWLRGSFPKKSLWASWILDPGFVDPFPRRVLGHLGSWILASWILSQEESLGILDLGSWLRGSFPKKSLWASWILDPASWILSQEESLGILDLGSWHRGSFPKKSLWASWVLDPGIVDLFPRRVFGHLGSWILASWILSQEESLGILDPWILASWILSQEESLGILDPWILASWILSQEESLGILDLGSWLRGSFPKKSLWASWILDPGFVDPFPRRVFGHLGSWILACWWIQDFPRRVSGHLGSWILDPRLLDPRFHKKSLLCRIVSFQIRHHNQERCSVSWFWIPMGGSASLISSSRVTSILPLPLRVYRWHVDRSARARHFAEQPGRFDIGRDRQRSIAREADLRSTGVAGKGHATATGSACSWEPLATASEAFGSHGVQCPEGIEVEPRGLIRCLGPYGRSQALGVFGKAEEDRGPKIKAIGPPCTCSSRCLILHLKSMTSILIIVCLSYLGITTAMQHA